MKIRNGYVSNSSTCSFCIHGWSSLKFKKNKRRFLKAFPNCEDMFELCHEMEKKHKIRLNYVFSCDFEEHKEIDIFGVGHNEYEVDDTKVEEPTVDEINSLNKIVEELDLPLPKMRKGTYRD